MSKYSIHPIISHDFHANTYVVEIGNGCIVIDAGATVQQIKNVCPKPVKAVLITHAHFDHILYLEEYWKEWGCSIYLSNNAGQKLSSPEDNLSCQFCEENCVIAIPDDSLKSIGAQEIVIEDLKLTSLVTIGHSGCSLSFILDEHCFCGDLLFQDGIGRTDFKDSNIVSLYKSMKNLLAKDIQMFYSGHGLPFSKEQFEHNFNRKI